MNLFLLCLAQIKCRCPPPPLLFLQVGCKMGCKFCATGSMGFKNNLSSGEIVEQLVHASNFAQIRNVVFMVIIFAPIMVYV